MFTKSITAKNAPAATAAHTVSRPAITRHPAAIATISAAKYTNRITVITGGMHR
jgi:hypothetical protein